MKIHFLLFQTIRQWHLSQVNAWRLVAFIFLTTITSVTLQAQVKLWDKTYGGKGTDGLAMAKQTSDGGYLVGGSSNSGISGDKSEINRGICNNNNCSNDYWVIKLKSDGSKAWDKTIGGDKSDDLRFIHQTKDNGYILIGFSESGKSGDKTDAGTGIWMVKLKVDGSKVWDKITDGDEFTSLQPTNDGGFILGGSTFSDTKSGEYWVAKFDSDGKRDWEKKFGGMDEDILTSLINTPDGGYLLGGYTKSGKGGDKSEPRKSNCTDDWEGDPCLDYWVVKINASGAKQWDKTYGGYADDVIITMTTTSDGGYLLGGNSESDKSLDRTESSRDDKVDENRGDYWLIKIKADGTKVWDRAYGGNRTDNLSSLVATPDGGYLMSGFSNSVSGGEMGLRRGIGSTWILKINAKGDKLWDTNVDSETQIVPASDGNILLAGTSGVSTTSTDYNYEYWLVKLQLPDKKVQTLTFYPPDKALTDSPYTLSAKINSGLPVRFKLLSGPATQKGNQLRFTGYGTVVVKAFQAGNAIYSPVEYTTSFQVQRIPKQEDKTLGGKGTDILADMVDTQDGGYLLAGSSASGNSGDKTIASKGSSDFWLVKVDKNKNKVWDKSFGGKDTETVVTILSTPDGGYLLGGTSASGKEGDKTEASKGKNDFWIVKVDAAGNKLWDKSFGGNQDDNLKALIATPDGGYIIGGTSQSGKSGDKSEDNKGKSYENGYIPSDIWLVKIDSNGKKVWDKTLGTSLHEFLSSILITADGGYLLGGNRQGCCDDGDYLVIKIDASGQQQWEKTYNWDIYNNLTAVASTPDGGYLLAGIAGFERYYYWVVKIDAHGNKIWDKDYGGNAVFTCSFCENNTSTPIKILSTSLDHFILAGYSYSDQGRDRSEKNRGSEDYWLLEIDANGQRIADKSFGGNRIDKLTAMIATPNGGYLLGGYSNSPPSHEKSENSKGDYDFWLVETQISTFPPANLAAWNLRYGGNNSDYLTTVLPTSDGGYLLGGYSYSIQSGDKTQNNYGKSDYWIVKTDGAGHQLWDKRYGGSGRDVLNTLMATLDGGYLLGGNSESDISGDKTQAGKGGKDLWIIKITSSGEKQWDQSYGGKGTEDLRKISVLPDGTCLLAGYSSSPRSGNKSQASQGGLDYWLVKINSFNGEKLWDKCYGGSGDDYLEDVLILDNGDLLLGGGSFSSQSGDRSQSSRGSSDYWLLRTNSEGKKLWDKRFGGSDQDHLFALLSRDTNTILLAGQSASGKGGDKSQPTQGKKDFWLLQVNSKGDKQWDKIFGGSEEETLRSIIKDKEGGYVLGGTSFSGKRGDKSQHSQGSSDYWLVKTNHQGEKLWDKRYGGSGAEELRAVWPTEDGGYLLGGRSNSGVSGNRTQPSQGGMDYWLVKVAPVITTLVTSREADVIEEPGATLEFNSLRAFPNPFRDKATVTFILPETQLVTVKVYDLQGRKVTTLFQGEAKANQTYQLEWHVGRQASKIYLLRLETAEKIYSFKILNMR